MRPRRVRRKVGGGVVKKIIIDGSEIEVFGYQWRTEQKPIYRKGHFLGNLLDKLTITIDYIKVKISRQNCKELLQKLLFSNEYVIEADNKKAKFYLCVDEMKRLFTWYKSESDEIEIEFIGTGNYVD